MEKVRRCIECGHHLPEDAHPLAGLCSKECKTARNNRARRERNLEKKRQRGSKCSECNGAIPPEMKVRSTCSDRCDIERRRRIDRERYRNNPDRRKACIDSYDRERVAEWRRDNPERHRESNRRRREAIKSTGSEPLLREEIFQSGNWTCGICQGPIDPSLTWPHRDSATVDHIIPLSKGGKHVRENVQPAHLGCNASKGNR